MTDTVESVTARIEAREINIATVDNMIAEARCWPDDHHKDRRLRDLRDYRDNLSILQSEDEGLLSRLMFDGLLEADSRRELDPKYGPVIKRAW